MNEQIGRLESRWSEVEGVRMHARVSVDPVPEGRVPVVLVHGQVVSSRYMIPTAERLAPHHPVHAPDLPGFGRSDKPRRTLRIPELADALAAWMEANGLERAALVGNSLGCQILADCAVRYPERVSRAVMQGPTTDPSARRLLPQTWRWLVNGTREPPGLTRVLVRDYRDAGLRRAIESIRYNLLGDRIEEKLPHVRAPTLVVRGERDSIVPQRWAEEATRLLPCGRLVVIPGVAHTINYSAPREFARVIRAFLGQDAPVPGTEAHVEEYR